MLSFAPPARFEVVPLTTVSISMLALPPKEGFVSVPIPILGLGSPPFADRPTTQSLYDNCLLDGTQPVRGSASPVRRRHLLGASTPSYSWQPLRALRGEGTRAGFRSHRSAEPKTGLGGLGGLRGLRGLRGLARRPMNRSFCRGDGPITAPKEPGD